MILKKNRHKTYLMEFLLKLKATSDQIQLFGVFLTFIFMLI